MSPLSNLERMSGEIATWRTTLPERSRYAITAALRQALGAAVRWRYLSENPATDAGSNPQPAPRKVRAFTPDESLPRHVLFVAVPDANTVAVTCAPAVEAQALAVLRPDLARAVADAIDAAEDG